MRYTSFSKTERLMGVFACLFLFFLASCETDTYLLRPQSSYYYGDAATRGITGHFPRHFFDNTVARLDTVVMVLQKMEADTPFVARFEENYGLPLWNAVYALADEDVTCFLVPLWKPDAEKKIEALWFFRIADGRMKFFPLSRTSIQGEEQSFIFDLLAYQAFGMNNAEQLVFEKAETPQTRMYIIFTECWDVYTGTEAHLEYSYTNCIDRTYWIQDSSIPPLGGGTGTGDVLYPGNDGGGSGSPSGSSKAKSIFQNDSLDKTVWEKVEDLIEEIIEDCMGENLYNAVKDFLDGEKINFQLTDDKDSSYSPSKKSIFLSKNDMLSGTLLHELFHVYQVKQSSDNISSMNKEIEAHLAQYKYLKKHNRLDDIPKKNFDGRWRAVQSIDENIDNNGNFIRGDSVSNELYAFQRELFETQFEYNVVAAFRKFGYNEAAYNSNLSIEQNFLNIKDLTINCN